MASILITITITIITITITIIIIIIIITAVVIIIIIIIIIILGTTISGGAAGYAYTVVVFSLKTEAVYPLNATSAAAAASSCLPDPASQANPNEAMQREQGVIFLLNAYLPGTLRDWQCRWL